MAELSATDRIALSGPHRPGSPYNEAPAHQSGTQRDLTSVTLGGLKWTYLATLCSAILQIGVTAVLSRLLTPAAYGIVAAAGIFLKFGSYFSEMGVGQALVQKPSLSAEDIRAAFTATSCIGFLVGGVTYACAPLSLHFLPYKEVVTVVRIMAMSLAVNGMASTSLNLLRRQLRFRPLSIMEVSSYALSSGAVAIPMAIRGAGVWALAAALVIQPLLMLCMAYSAARHSLRPCFQWQVHKLLLAYGGKLSLTSFSEYLFFLADTVIVGKLWGATLLGIYTRANLLSSLLIQNASTAMIKVLFPAFSRAQSEGRRMASAYLQGITVLSLITIPLAAGIFAAAQDIVSVVLGKQYESAAVLVQIFVISVPMNMGASLAATICNVKGQVGKRLRHQMTMLPVMWLAVLFVAPWGVRAIAATSVAVQGLQLISFQYLAKRSLGIKWTEVLAAVRPGVQLAALVAAAILTAGHALPHSLPLFRFLTEWLAGLLACIIYSVWCPPTQVVSLMLRVLDSLAPISRGSILLWYRRRLATVTEPAPV